ncbi:MAG: aldehyde dehydrogenase EutE, partial [Candidatus Latescibacteria bacterium]|nr:aldehyde dehydrogenase EutE [Candidatus Latescibacterota bacterium]
MQIDEARIRAIVEEVVREFSQRERLSPQSAPLLLEDRQAGSGIFPTVDDAVEAAEIAQEQLMKLTLEKRKEIIQAIRTTGVEYAEDFSQRAREETGMGRVEDKIRKHLIAATLTPGVEDLASVAWSGDHGLTVVEMAPYGVICAVTPSTHPVPTILNNAISIIAAGNSVVFNPHPGAKRVSLYGIQRINEGIIAAGGPPNLLTVVENPTIETAQALMKHPKVDVLLVTGGPGVARAAMNSGKKAIVAGPGNPPVVVDETADIEKAARDTIDGASFDNNILCIGEKEVFVVESVADHLKTCMKNYSACELTPEQIEQLTKVAFKEQNGELVVNKELVGKDACILAEKIGLSISQTTRMLIGETTADHPFVQHEQMMSFLPVVRVPDVQTAIDLAIQAEHGYGHTAVIHSRNVETMTIMGKRSNVSLYIKNGPSYAGLGVGGEGFTSFSIAGPTGEGATSARTFTRQRRCTMVDYLR